MNNQMSSSISEISKALLLAQKEMGNAVKDSKNPFFKSKYADLNAVREVSIPVLNKHEIVVLQPTTMVDNKSFVVTTLLHSSGQYISSYTEIVAAKANDPQALGSAISYARRYGLQSLVCIGAEDDDGEKAMSRTVKTEPQTVTQVEVTQEVSGFTGLKKPKREKASEELF